MNHSMCDECWNRFEAGREPHRLNNATERTCCTCGNRSTSGIFVRLDSSKTLCKGVHSDDETKKLDRADLSKALEHKPCGQALCPKCNDDAAGLR